MRADGSSKRAMPLDKVDGGEAFLVYKINGEQDVYKRQACAMSKPNAPASAPPAARADAPFTNERRLMLPCIVVSLIVVMGAPSCLLYTSPCLLA